MIAIAIAGLFLTMIYFYLVVLIMSRPFVSYCVQVYGVAIARKRSPYIATKM